MKCLAFLTVLLLSVYLTFEEFPEEFKRCDRSNKKFNKCLSNAVGDAIKKLTEPKYGLPDLEPLTIKYFRVLQYSKWRPIVPFGGSWRNYEIHGITKSNFTTKTELNLATKHRILDLLKINLTYPKLEHKFNCSFRRDFMNRSIEGKGSGSAISTNTNIFYAFDLLRRKTFNKKVRVYRSWIEAEKVEYNFDSYEGVISAEELTRLVNENSILFFNLAMESLVRGAWNLKLEDNLLNFFNKFPIKELW